MTTSSAERHLPPVSTSNPTTATRIALWASTGLFSLMFTLSGVLFLAGPAEVVASFRHLGYPDCFRHLLGIAKLLGVAALLVPPPSPVLREWAYAGFAFTCIAAAASHLMSGDGPVKVVGPVLAMGLLLTSYVLRRRVARGPVAA